MITYSITRIIKPGEVIRLPNKGMNSPGGKKRGDMIIKIDIVFPDSLPSNVKDFVSKKIPRFVELKKNHFYVLSLNNKLYVMRLLLISFSEKKFPFLIKSLKKQEIYSTPQCFEKIEIER